MSSLHVCFSNLTVKSQPEVALSQTLFDFGTMNHDLIQDPNSIPIPQQQLPLNAIMDDNYGSSFGSFSSAADSLVHDNAIVIPTGSPNSTFQQDFCLMDDQEQDGLGLLSTSSAYESDISFCSPTTPMANMVSPYCFSMDDMMLIPSSPWNISSPSPSSSSFLDPTGYLENSQQQEMVKEETTTTTKKRKPAARRREYKCPHCPRKSNRSNNMKEHILTHDPNRPKNFACTVCTKRFARKHDLKRHIQSHERSIQKMMIACGLAPPSSL